MMSGMQGLDEVKKSLEQTNPEMARALGSLQSGVSPKSAAPARRQTKEEKAYTEASDKIDQMKKECVKYENPDDYAKYGKMQR